MSQGGVRPGAGRKCLAPEARRAPVCFSVSPEVRRKLQELRRSGVDMNKLVSCIIATEHDRVFGEHDTRRLDEASRKYLRIENK